MDLALSNLQRLISHKTQTTNQNEQILLYMSLFKMKFFIKRIKMYSSDLLPLSKNGT